MQVIRNGKLITFGFRLLMIGLLVPLLLGLERRAPDASIATAAPPMRQKYVIQNIRSNQTSYNLDRLKDDLVREIRKQNLSNEPEDLKFSVRRMCKLGQNCDLVTIDVDMRQLVIICSIHGEQYLPSSPYKCPAEYGKYACIAPLPEQLSVTLWSHDQNEHKERR